MRERKGGRVRGKVLLNKCFTKCSSEAAISGCRAEGNLLLGEGSMKTTMESKSGRVGVTACEELRRYMRVISSHFPRHIIASLRQVDVSSLTPLLRQVETLSYRGGHTQSADIGALEELTKHLKSLRKKDKERQTRGNARGQERKIGCSYEAH